MITLTGPAWLGLLGGGYLHGHLDSHGRMTGDSVSFIYPDLKTVLTGKFENGFMKEAKEAKVKGFRCGKDGILEAQMEIIEVLIYSIKC